MSNRVNRALADAWLTADIAATERTFQSEYNFALEKWDKELEEAEEAMKDHEDGRSGWAKIGSYVGAAIGTVAGYYTGGPLGAAKGATKGYNIGDDLAMMGYDLDSYHIDKVTKATDDVKDFDYEFSRAATKYKVTQDKEDLYDVAEEKAVDKATEAIRKFEDAYDKSDWDVVIDTAVNVYEDWNEADKMFNTLSAGATKFSESAFGDWIGADTLLSKGQDLQTIWEGTDTFNIKMFDALESFDLTTSEGQKVYQEWVDEYARLFGEDS